MRSLLTGVTLTALALTLAACGSSSSSAASKDAERDAALYQIDQIERTWHKAASTHDLDLMMSIWAPNATIQGNGTTTSGKAAIRALLAKAAPFQAQNHWVSETPAYKIRTTVSGDKGTLYFECHYVDTKTGKVMNIVGADQDVKKIDGKWLITNMSIASPTLTG
jgi:ketosteroid isomerase-like protein